MSCYECVHYGRKARFCEMRGEQVKAPTAGACRYEEHDSECPCAGCERRKDEPDDGEES